MKLSLVIPCYNEELAIPHVMERLRSSHQEFLAQGVELNEVIVVDDFSSDSSRQLLKTYPEVRMIEMPGRSGYGAALKAGIRAAQGDFVAMMDMDSTYDPFDLPHLTKALKDLQLVMMSGNRLVPGNAMPKTRLVGNKFYSILFHIFCGMKVNDVCSGMRVLPLKFAKDQLNRWPDGLDFTLAISVMCARQSLPFAELPIRYSERKGPSKLSILLDGLRFFKRIVSA